MARGDKLKKLDIVDSRRGSVILAVAFALLFLYLIRDILLPFVLAGVLAYVSYPLIRLLNRRLGLPRLVAGLIVFVGTMSLIGSVAWLAGGTPIRDLIHLSVQFPKIVDNGMVWLFGRRIELFGQTVNVDELTAAATEDWRLWASNAKNISTLAQTGVTALFYAVTSVVLFLYLALSGERLGRGLLRLLPPAYRPTMQRVAVEVHPILSRYFVGLAIVTSYTILAAWIGIGPVLGLPHAAALAVLSGMLELIPVAGPVFAAALVGSVAATQAHLTLFGAFLIYVVILRVSIDYAVGPLVLGKAASLHPVVILFALMAGGALAGLVGVIIAVPVATALKVVLAAVYEETSTAGTT